MRDKKLKTHNITLEIRRDCISMINTMLRSLSLWYTSLSQTKEMIFPFYFLKKEYSLERLHLQRMLIHIWYV